MLLSIDALWILVAALVLDALIGDPDWIWRRIPHPVVVFGALIAWMDRTFNRDSMSFALRRTTGAAMLIVLIAISGAVGWLVETLAGGVAGGMLLTALIASVFLAQRSLYQHVARVRGAFAAGGVGAARSAVAMIVGRDPESLDEAGVCRAAIESCAENFSDGVAAPAFWFALLGLPGLVAYKAVNTADSMIGHRGERYLAFGWASARVDDVLNLVPARLSGLLMALVAPLAGGSASAALAAMWRDARRHRSPNAGWPEAAMAGALGLALAGPRRYGEHVVDDPFINPQGRLAATPDDVTRALNILLAACLLHAAIYAALALAF